MPDPAPNYLDPHALAAVAPLELRARLIVEGLMTGLHRSPYYGYAVEFAQHRQYAPGDDIRRLDWKVFGRTDKLYLKQHQKETHLDLLLLVDSSPSMAYSSGGAKGWRKYDHAASLAAALGYLALRQQDRVGLVLFADQPRATVRPSNAHGHWRAIVDSLSAVTFPPTGAMPSAVPSGRGRGHVADPSEAAPPGTDLARLFEHLSAKLTQRSLVVLISDLFVDTAIYERGVARLRHRGHDLIVLHVLDPAERTFPFRSPAEFYGLEGEGRLTLDPAALRQAYLDALAEHLTQLEDTTRRLGFDYLLLDTAEPLGAPLGHFLARRTAASSRG